MYFGRDEFALTFCGNIIRLFNFHLWWVEPLGLVEPARCYPLRFDGDKQISIQEFGLTWSESYPLAVIMRNPPFHMNFNHQNTMPLTDFVHFRYQGMEVFHEPTFVWGFESKLELRFKS